FIGNEDAAVIADDFFDDRKILLGWSDEAADALYRLADETGYLAAGGRADQVFDILGALHAAIGVLQVERASIAIGVVGMNNACLRRSELPRALARESHGTRRTAVIGMAKRDNLRVSRVAARCEDGRLIGFRAAVGEEALGELAAWGEACDLLSERGLRLIGEQGGDVLQGIELLVKFGVHFVVAVADAHCDDAAEKIEVLVSIGIPDILVFRMRNHERLLIVMKNCGKEELLIG